MTGPVEIRWGNQTRTGQLAGEQVTFALGSFKKPGSYDVLVTYGGSSTAEAVTRTYTIEVHKK